MILERYARLLSTKSVEEWFQELIKLANVYGFNQSLVAIFANQSLPMEAQYAFLHSNYSTAWRNKYDEQCLGYIDPTVSHCLTKSSPLVWSPPLFSTVKQNEMYEEACSFNLRSGLTLPIHGPNGEYGMLCMVSDITSNREFESHVEHHIAELSYLRDFILESSAAFREHTTYSSRPLMLTPSEKECLKWCAIGKSSWEIGHILTCSEATVNFHMGNIRRKLNVTNRRQAVVKAIKLGVIYPS